MSRTATAVHDPDVLAERAAQAEQEAAAEKAAEQAARAGKPLPPARGLESVFPEVTFTCAIPDRSIRLRHLSIKFVKGRYTTRHPDEIAYLRRAVACDPYGDYAEEGQDRDDFEDDEE